MARVLIVEDDPDIANLFTFYMQDAGHSVLVARSERAATMALAAASFDVAIVDWLADHRPTGPHVASRLKAAHPALKFIVCGGLEEMLWRVAPDADAVLGRPWSAGDLEQLVASLVG